MAEAVTMYGADWCGDRRRAKQYFADNNVNYTWIDVLANPDEIETVMRYNGGRRSIPVVVFEDGTHLTEPSNAELEAKLGA
ncbi:MAG: NrdH-redoxin [Proteobacteria bacterium]|nr:NrdH-redoxin [Pseudomonadota bacterium]